MQEIQIDKLVAQLLKNYTILCVDDSKTQLTIYKTILHRYVDSLLFARDGQEALEVYTNKKVDIIITDYEMPLLNGIEFIKEVRKQNSSIPIHLVTSLYDADILKEAINLNVTSFITKPINPKELLFRLEESIKLIIASNYLIEEKNRQIKELEEKEEYVNYQQELAFQKELNILRNDFYYKMINFKRYEFIDFFYKPLDTLSGDAYSARVIDKTHTFYLLVDGMGKGISASLSTILLTAYVNKVIDDMLQFDFEAVIEKSMRFIQPILLEYETISVDFVAYKKEEQELCYAKFGMPSFLLEEKSGRILKIKSNNPPMSKYLQKFTISHCNISNIIKLLFYTDGLPENSTIYDNKIYNDYIEEDFAFSLTKEDMRQAVMQKIQKREDDMTFIFISKPDKEAFERVSKEFATTFEAFEEAVEWYEQWWNDHCHDTVLINRAMLVFNELYMNAFEHGNLGIGMDEKAYLIAEDRYDEELQKRAQDCSKKITITIATQDYKQKRYIITTIEDEGNGFSDEVLMQIFRNEKGLRDSFNGRGILMSRKASDGIYYNQKGNGVTFIHSASL